MASRTTRSPEARRRSASPRLPSRARLAALKLSREVAWYLVNRGIPLPRPDQVPRWKTPEPGEVLDGAMFDPARVDRVLQSFGRLVHTQGRWAGRPLKPDPWQVAYFLAPVFGWVRFDDEAQAWVRVVRTAEADLSRKNGKTTIAGGIATYLTCADGEMGAQVLAVAASLAQAQYCFRPVKQIAESSPALRPHVQALASRIVHRRSGSYFAVVASVGDLLHGANVHGAIIDELHVHRTRDVVDAVETGTGARTQPLVVIITTPDEGRPGTIYAEKRGYLEKLARHVIRDPTFYGVVWGFDSERELADLGLTPFQERAWRRANPGYGISPTKAFLESEAAKAKDSPAALARFLRLHLGIRTKQATRYIRLEAWDAAAGGPVDEDALAGRACHGGLDLASVSDLTALCWMFPDRYTAAGGSGFDAVWRFWLPDAALADVNKRTAGMADVWVREGWLQLTPGAVLDTAAVNRQIDLDAQKFAVKTIGYDRWGASEVTRTASDAGLTLVGVGQGYASMSAPLKEMLRLTLTGKLRNGANPVMRWCIDNLAVAMDPAGNTKPDKAAAADKIDGVSAAVMALKECMDAELEDKANPPASAPTPPRAAPERGIWRPTSRLAL
jgi:phage terminase large subunit-like protein